MPAEKHNEDEELISLMNQKTKEGFERLYAQYAGALYGIIKGMVPDSGKACKLLEDTFVCAWAGIEQYEREESSLFIWLMSICRRLCKQYIKEQMPGNKQVNAMPGVDYKSVVEMICLGGHSYDEVANKMNVPVNTVLQQTRTGLQSFKKRP